MKKNLLYALALATSMVACTDDYTDWATPQQNGQDALKNASLTVTAAPSIDFATVITEYLPVFTSPTVTSDETFEVSAYTVTLNEKHTLNVTLKDSEGLVAASELEAALIDLYGRRPTERTMSGLVKAYVKNADGMTVIPTTTIEIKATPVAPIIEEAYYLVGAPNNWDWTDDTYKFNHSDADVYDDPIFTLTFKAPVDENGNRVDCWFKINPQSAFEEGGETATTLGCTVNGSTELTGSLVYKKEESDPNAGAMMMPASDGAKFYKIELNMMDYTYTVTPLNFDEFIYVPGDHQNWTPSSAPTLQSPNFDGVYTGYVYLNTQFKFTLQNNWDNGEYNYSTFTTYSDIFSGEGTGNINVNTPGYYRLVADVPSASLTAEAINWGVIGDATANGWDASTPMNLDTATGTWSVTITLNDGTFKFRANDDWTYNFGGTAENLVPGGDNIPVTAGTYEIVLNLNDASNYHCTITKK